jgi:multisubunit Na+/H+ antiporter MnhB subunit
MQRLLGVLLSIVGGIVVLWAAYYVMTGQSSYRLRLTDDFSVSALTGGLAGVAVFTVGLIWLRD